MMLVTVLQRVEHHANKTNADGEPVKQAGPGNPILLSGPCWPVARNHLFGHDNDPLAALTQTTRSDTYRDIEDILVGKLHFPVRHGPQQRVAWPGAEEGRICGRTARRALKGD